LKYDAFIGPGCTEVARGHGSFDQSAAGNWAPSPQWASPGSSGSPVHAELSQQAPKLRVLRDRSYACLASAPVSIVMYAREPAIWDALG